MDGNVSSPQMGSPALSNQISSMGSPQMEQAQNPSPVQNQAADFINRFGVIFQDFKTLANEYPTAKDEFNLVVAAMKNWQAAASDAMANSGGESTTY